MNAFFQKLVEVSFVVLAFGSMYSERLGGKKTLLAWGRGRSLKAEKLYSSLLFAQTVNPPCSCQEQGRVQANCSLLYRARFIQSKTQRPGRARSPLKEQGRVRTRRDQQSKEEKKVHGQNLRARRRRREIRFRARFSFVARALRS